MINLSKPLKTLAVISTAISLTGCLSLLPQAADAPSIYRLSQAPMALQVAPNAAVVRISVPVAPKALGGEDVVVSPDGRRLAYAQGASWAQPIPRLLQSAITGAFGQNTSLNAIVAPTVARADYALEISLHSFEANFDQGEDQAPLALVRLTATLTDLNTRAIVGTKRIFCYAPRSRAPGRGNCRSARRGYARGDGHVNAMDC